jgi:hypothetical protein
VNQPNTIQPVHPATSSSLLNNDQTYFTNPPYFHYNLDKQREQLQPFLKPGAPAPVYQPPVVSPDETELDFALTLGEELPPVPPPQMTQHYPQHSYYPPQNVFNPPMIYGQPQTPPFRVVKRRVVEDEDDEHSDFSALDSVPSIDFGEGEEDPTGGFKLPASKSPIMEAMVVCALNSWGIDLITNNRPTSASPGEVVFRVNDFNRYYHISRAICSKQRPTDDLGSRIKSLRRWFVNFPKKKDRNENSFNLTVKPTIAKKVSEIIERNSKSLGLTKRRRRQ